MKLTYYTVSLFCLSGVVVGFCSTTTATRRRIHHGAQLLTSLSCAKTSHTEKSSFEAIRLNKVFKSTHSRRQADDLIASGRVTINGEPVDSAGRRVVPFQDVVALDGHVVEGWEALNACMPQNNTRRKQFLNT